MPAQQLVSDQEALALGAFGGGWSVGTALAISSQAQKQIALNRDTTVLRIQTESDVHVLFDTTTGTANTAANDPVLPAGYHEIPVPRGLYGPSGPSSTNVIYCHLLQEVSAPSKTLRFVES